MLSDLFNALLKDSADPSEVAELLGFDFNETRQPHHGSRIKIIPEPIDLPDGEDVNPQIPVESVTYPVYFIKNRTPQQQSDTDRILVPFTDTDSTIDSEQCVVPSTPLIINRSELITLISNGLLQTGLSRLIDVTKLTERMAALRPVDPLPRLTRANFIGRYWVVADDLPTLSCDINILQRQLFAMPALLRPQEQLTLSNAKECWIGKAGRSGDILDLAPLPAGVALLIVGDPEKQSSLLRRVIDHCCSRHTRIHWLSPEKSNNSIYWGKRGEHVSGSEVLRKIMAMLFPYPHITRAMIRVLRQALRAPTSVEIEFWQHRDCHVESAWCETAVVEHNRNTHRSYLIDWLNNEPDEVRKLLEILDPYVRALAPAYRHEAVLNLSSQLTSAKERQQASDYFATLASSVDVEHKSGSAHSCSQVVLGVNHRLVSTPTEVFSASVARAQAYWHRQVDQGEALLAGVHPTPQDSQAAMLVQRGAQLFAVTKTSGSTDYGRVGFFDATNAGALIDLDGARYLIPFSEPLPQESFTLLAVDEHIHVCVADSGVFHWAESLEQNANSLSLTTSEALRVHYPAGKITEQAPVIDTTNAPAWLKDEAIGIDEYGLFTTLNIYGIEQEMRWIPPGHFMMGSREDENERDDDETLHQVILSDGYWLASTLCTQALWRVVMGENPSEFIADDLPVDSISWEMAHSFLNTVNTDNPDLNLMLPTEAQWEYACRAGTRSAFNVGDAIHDTQANFGGAVNKTNEAGRYPQNGWGLYDMHGNLWEWCEDKFDEYRTVVQVNPRGPEGGENRVLRGGSWIFNAGNCRSAYRYGSTPSNRNDNIGFRFAQVDPQVAAKHQPVEEAKQARRSRISRAVSDQVSKVSDFFKQDEDK